MKGPQPFLRQLQQQYRCCGRRKSTLIDYSPGKITSAFATSTISITSAIHIAYYRGLHPALASGIRSNRSIRLHDGRRLFFFGRHLKPPPPARNSQTPKDLDGESARATQNYAFPVPPRIQPFVIVPVIGSYLKRVLSLQFVFVGSGGGPLHRPNPNSILVRSRYFGSHNNCSARPLIMGFLR